MESFMRFRLILQSRDGTLYKTHSSRRRRIVQILWGRDWQNADLEVVYFANGQEIGRNRGVYCDPQKAADALTAFIDPEVLLCQH